MTLLEKAKQAPQGNRCLSDNVRERAELAIAYANGQVTAKQAGDALGCSTNNATTKLGCAILAACRSGIAKVELL